MSIAAQPNPEILESKLRRPWARPGIVSRAALVDRLLASHHVPVVCVVAPAGYGKTTLLSQWAEQRGRAAWVSLDERDNDPEILLACAAAALDRVEAIDPELLRTRWLGGSSIAATAVTRLAGAMSATTEPVALVLDHLELLANQDVPRRGGRARAAPAGRVAAGHRHPRRAAAADGAAACRRRGRGGRRRRPRHGCGRGARSACGCGDSSRRHRPWPADRADRGLAGRPLPRGPGHQGRRPRGDRGAPVLRG